MICAEDVILGGELVMVECALNGEQNDELLAGINDGTLLPDLVVDRSPRSKVSTNRVMAPEWSGERGSWAWF